MIFLLTTCIYIFIIGLAILICLILKIYEQRKIKKQRINLLSKNTFCNNDTYIYQNLYEIYTSAFSHYLTYSIGHFSNILLNIYSIVFSITALSMVSFDIANDITQVISLLSTFFVVTLVFSHLDERSKRHYTNWKNCENFITQISQITSIYTDDNKKVNEIYAIITSYRENYSDLI